MSSTLEQQLRSYIIDTFLFGEGGDMFSDDESLLEQGILDSTGVLELVAFLNESFEIKVADHELVAENFDSVSRLSAFVRRRQIAAPSQDPQSPQNLGQRPGVNV